MNIAPNIPASEPKPVKSPVHIFGQDNILTCGEFYNWMWEECCHDRVTFHMDNAAIERIIEPIAEYLTALLFVRWAVSADIDIEDGLQEKIRSVFEKSARIIDQPLPELPIMCDHNEDDFIFSPEDRLSNWLGECLSDAAGNLSGFGGGSMHVPDEEFIYTLGERPGYTKPCFRNEAFEHAFVAVHGQMSIIYGSLRCVGVDMTEIMRKGIFSKDAQHYPPYHDIDDCEIGSDSYKEIKGLVEDGIITPDNASILIVGDEADDLSVQCGLVQFMDLFDLIDDDIDRFIVVQSSRGELVQNRMRKLVEALKIPVLLDIRTDEDEEKRIPGAVNHLVSSARCKPWMIQWKYEGEMPDALVREADAYMSCGVVSSMIQDLVTMEDEHMHSGLSGCYSELNEIVERRMIELMGLILHGEYDIEHVEELVEIHDAGEFTDNRSVMLVSYCQANFNETNSSQRLSTPLYDRMSFMQNLYDREDIIVKPQMDAWARTVYDASADRCEASDEKILDEMLSHMIERRNASGIESSIDAYDKGIPASDILA